MKAELILRSDGKPQLEIEPENDTEAIAIQSWSEKYDRQNDEAYMIIKLTVVQEST